MASSANPLFLGTAARFLVGWALGNSLNTFINYVFGIDPGDLARVQNDARQELRQLALAYSKLVQDIDELEESLRLLHGRHIEETLIYAEALRELGVFVEQLDEYQDLLASLTRIDDIVASRDEKSVASIYQHIRRLHDFDPQRIFSLEVVARLKAHEAELRNHEHLIATIQRQLQHHSNRLGALEKDVADLQIEALRQAQRLAALETDVNNNQTDIYLLDEEVKTHENFLNNLVTHRSEGDLLVLRAEDTSRRSAQFGAYLRTSLAPEAQSRSLTLTADSQSVTSPRRKYLLTYRAYCKKLDLGGAKCQSVMHLRTLARSVICTLVGLGRTEDFAFSHLIKKTSIVNYGLILDGQPSPECE